MRVVELPVLSEGLAVGENELITALHYARWGDYEIRIAGTARQRNWPYLCRVGFGGRRFYIGTEILPFACALGSLSTPLDPAQLPEPVFEAALLGLVQERWQIAESLSFQGMARNAVPSEGVFAKWLHIMDGDKCLGRLALLVPHDFPCGDFAQLVEKPDNAENWPSALRFALPLVAGRVKIPANIWHGLEEGDILFPDNLTQNF